MRMFIYVTFVKLRHFTIAENPKSAHFVVDLLHIGKTKKHLILFSPYNINIITNFARKSIESFNFFV